MPTLAPTLAAWLSVDMNLWIRNNIPLLVWSSLLIVGLLIARLVLTRVTRNMALAIVALLLLGVYSNRLQLRDCAVDCECTLATVEVDVPACNPHARF